MIRRLIFSCLLTIGASSVKADATLESGGRIVNGQAIDISQAPYIVQLKLLYGGFFCGGTLVTPQHVVTAAHCFDMQTPEYTRVVAGVTTSPGTGQERRVVSMVKPPNYTSTNMHNDVAILKLEKPLIMGPRVKTVNLCSKPLVPGAKLRISGWGSTVSGGYSSDKLLSIEIPAISKEQCVASHKNTRTAISSSMFCAHSPHMDSCQGDSGGPAIYNGELCGIVSWGVGCAEGRPGVYSDVFVLKNYIESVIRSM